jgi:hypothetical protein
MTAGLPRHTKRVTNILDEKTGKMSRLKTASIILEDVFCQSRYSYRHMFSPRAIYPYWREIWLQRVAEKNVGQLT